MNEQSSKSRYDCFYPYVALRKLLGDGYDQMVMRYRCPVCKQSKGYPCVLPSHVPMSEPHPNRAGTACRAFLKKNGINSNEKLNKLMEHWEKQQEAK